MRKKSIIFIGGLVMLLLVGWVGLMLAFPYLVDAEKIRTETEKRIYDATGYKVVIKRAEAKFRLTPSIIFYNVTARASKNQLSARIFSASMVEVDITFSSMFDDEPKPIAMDTEFLVVNVDEMEDGKYSIPAPVATSKKAPSIAFPPSMTFRNSRINYTPFGSKAVYEFRDIVAKLTFEDSGDISVDSGFLFNKKRFNVDATLNALKELSGFNADVTLSYGKNAPETLLFKGKWGKKNAALFTQGTLEYRITDISTWLGFIDLSGVETGLYTALSGYGLEGALELEYVNNTLTLKTIKSLFNGESLRMEMRALLQENINFSFNASLDKIKFENVNDSVNGYDLLERVLVKSVEGDIQLHIGQIEFQDKLFNNAQFEGTIIDQELVINKSLLAMEGDTKALLFGIVRRNEQDLVNLDGNIEIIGKDFQAFINAMKLDQNQFMKEYEGEFRAKANVYFAPHQSLLSEARFQVANVFMDGNIEYQPNGPIHYTFNMRARQLDLNNIANYLNPFPQQNELEGGYGLTKMHLPFLEDVTKNYRFNIVLDSFDVWGERGRSSKVVADISHNQIRLSDMNINLGTMSIKGDLGLNQQEEVPQINGNIYLSQWDVNKWVGGNFRRFPVERGNVISIWDDEPFDVSFMQGYDGKLRVSIGVVSHDAFTMRDVVFDALIDGGEWRISEFSGALWGGDLKAKGTMDVASILAVNMDFVFKGILLEQFLRSTVDLSALQGRVNMYGNVSMGGLSVTNLVDSLQGQMVMSGQEVSIAGFDLAGMIQTLPTIRNISDVANTVRVSLLGGKTTFNAIEGAFYFESGLFKSHGVKLRSKHAIGTIKGEANLVSWGMDYTLSFKLPTLVVGDVAELSVFAKESMDEPLISVDSRQLESFMAKRKAVR
jgi:uncharacterized protein involved in outer membrane biogenesis